MDDVLESDRGFLRLFAPDADPGRALAGLGEQFEVLEDACKPYPGGIVVHAAVDACLDAVRDLPEDTTPDVIRLTVPPLAKSLADRRQPSDMSEAQISLQHWAAFVCLRRSAGIPALQDEAISAPDVVALREHVEIIADTTFGRDEAAAEIVLRDRTASRVHIRHARGSTARPMTDSELDAKFRGQVCTVLSDADVERLIGRLRTVMECAGVATWLLR